jgi:MFS transporter, ACS family, aldohexuronate transporter
MGTTAGGAERSRLDPSTGAGSGSGPGLEAGSGPGYRRSGYRWTILALLFAATTINYLDRQVFGILAPSLQHDLGWTEADYGNMVSWFSLTYGIGMLVMGRVLDRIGTRRGFAFSLVAWSVAAMGHAFARTAAGFSAARALLGLGESGNFPASIKTVSEWFPNSERALAVGIFNAGSNVGAVLAPIVVPWLALTWGWQTAFIGTGAIGFIWLIFWLAIYREPGSHPKVSPAELEFIRADQPASAPQIPWTKLLRYRQTWAFLIGKALTDPVWLFYLFWLPKFLDAGWGVKLAGVAAPLVAIYVFADTGSVIGGWFSSTLIKRGWSVNKARKTAMLVAALLIVPTLFAPRVGSMWGAVALVSVAAAAHQWWSANLFTSVSDMFPRSAVGSVTGIGGFAGAMAGFLFQRYTGAILGATGGNYGIIFAICGVAYLGAWVVFQILVPRMARV